MSISPPTLKQLAAKIVVLKELPTAHLPKTVKEDFQALPYLPGNFVVTESSLKVFFVVGVMSEEKVKVGSARRSLLLKIAFTHSPLETLETLNKGGWAGWGRVGWERVVDYCWD